MLSFSLEDKDLNSGSVNWRLFEDDRKVECSWEKTEGD